MFVLIRSNVAFTASITLLLGHDGHARGQVGGDSASAMLPLDRIPLTEIFFREGVPSKPRCTTRTKYEVRLYDAELGVWLWVDLLLNNANIAENHGSRYEGKKYNTVYF